MPNMDGITAARGDSQPARNIARKCASDCADGVRLCTLISKPALRREFNEFLSKPVKDKDLLASV